MFTREMQSELLQMVKEYPVVTLIGPRQAGKTTLVKQLFASKPYFNMEAPDIRQFATEDPRSFLDLCKDGAILDEIQRVPELLSYIQVMVDEKQKNGLFILTGSHQLDLHAKITQSLAGRTAILSLLPLSINEVTSQPFLTDVNQMLLSGFMPRIHAENQQPTKAYRNYLQTYIERDVRNLIHIKELTTFQKFIVLCAGRTGQLINYDDMSREIGVSNPTIKNWLSILDASFITARLQPYFANINKRLIKTPKLYFIETGLAAYLLGIETAGQMSRDPLKGQLFENMIVMELMKQRFNKGLSPNLYFYRDQQNHEVDVIYKQGRELIPIEIKSSKTFNKQFLKQLLYFESLFPDICKNPYIIYSGDYEQKIGNTALINYLNVKQIFERK